MVERAVLLHQQHDMLDVANRARPRRLASARRTLGGRKEDAKAAAASRAVFPNSRRRVIFVESGVLDISGLIDC